MAPDFRRIGLANRLMDFLESVSEKMYVENACPVALSLTFGAYISYNGYFVDLFVRVSNKTAIGMYKKLGYIVYRQVREYYSGEEDAYGTISYTYTHSFVLCQHTGHRACVRLGQL